MEQIYHWEAYSRLFSQQIAVISFNANVYK